MAAEGATRLIVKNNGILLLLKVLCNLHPSPEKTNIEEPVVEEVYGKKVAMLRSIRRVSTDTDIDAKRASTELLINLLHTLTKGKSLRIQVLVKYKAGILFRRIINADMGKQCVTMVEKIVAEMGGGIMVNRGGIKDFLKRDMKCEEDNFGKDEDAAMVELVAFWHMRIGYDYDKQNFIQ